MTDEVTMVRIYCTEGERKMKETLSYLHDVEKVAGVTAFRGVAGFGRSGRCTPPRCSISPWTCRW